MENNDISRVLPVLLREDTRFSYLFVLFARSGVFTASQGVGKWLLPVQV